MKFVKVCTQAMGLMVRVARYQLLQFVYKQHRVLYLLNYEQQISSNIQEYFV